jgi:hypothetical protein
MAEVNVTPEDVRQAEALKQALSAPQAEAIDVCATWKTVKPYWPWIIKAVKLIPTIGDVIAKALELIGNALDAYCGDN